MRVRGRLGRLVGTGVRVKRSGQRAGAHVAAVILLGAACLGGGLPAGTAAAAATREAAGLSGSRVWSLGLRWENDSIADQDRYYTNGAALWLAHTGPSWADPLVDLLPWREGRRTVTYAISQTMFTPEDTTRPIPDPADRPYAGVLTFGLGLHVDHEHRYHGLKLLLGVVGPWSGAGETQREWHRWVESSVPQGWGAQIHNEPIANLGYEHRRKYRLLGRSDGWAVEATPIAGVMLGNLSTQGHLGGQLRLGYRIPDDFGGTLLRGMGELPPPRGPLPDATRAGSTLGFYVEGGVHESLVLRDVTLDGNTFRDSASVDRKLLVPTATLCAGVGNRHFQATLSYVFRGKEFDGQPSPAEFGSLTFTYFY
jgi:hypothetical protein